MKYQKPIKSIKNEYKLGINKKKPKTKIFEPLRKKEKWCI